MRVWAFGGQNSENGFTIDIQTAVKLVKVGFPPDYSGMGPAFLHSPYPIIGTIKTAFRIGLANRNRIDLRLKGICTSFQKATPVAPLPPPNPTACACIPAGGGKRWLGSFRLFECFLIRELDFLPRCRTRIFSNVSRAAGTRPSWETDALGFGAPRSPRPAVFGWPPAHSAPQRTESAKHQVGDEGAHQIPAEKLCPAGAYPARRCPRRSPSLKCATGFESPRFPSQPVDAVHIQQIARFELSPPAFCTSDGQNPFPDCLSM